MRLAHILVLVISLSCDGSAQSTLEKVRALDLNASDGNITTYYSAGYEGADEAAKYYQRNLRTYSNLNRIDLDEDDRVFILMGASHTAFFRDFMSRGPKYKMVDTHNYLK